MKGGGMKAQLKKSFKVVGTVFGGIACFCISPGAGVCLTSFF